ncbi:POK18 protein, partial [Rostratula benghalensis]|nr:POK18 protein [Rostratula benghalensis]
NNVCKHLTTCFAVMGVPESIKTDNGPSCSSEARRQFLNMWGVEHKTGIPHSRTRQAIIEHTQWT